MVKIEGVYEGGLRCRMKHGPSGAELLTDAPVDNHGQGAAFSPTDLVATALGSCMMTIMGIVARKHGIDMDGTRVEITKEMAVAPSRRIGRIGVVLRFPRPLGEKGQEILKRAAAGCPVHHSLHPDVQTPVEFVFPRS
jgi:uncharacterized OsmC-like protein